MTSERMRFADVKDLPVGRDHAVDPGFPGQRAHELADHPHAVGKRAFARRQALAGGRALARFLVALVFVDHGCGEVCEEATSTLGVTPASRY